MIFDMDYNRQEFLKILQTKICPDFVQDIRPLECSRQTKFIKDGIFQLGTIKFLDYEVSVLEIKQVSWKDPRITLTKDAFKLLHDHQKDNALVVFRSDNTKTWRLSLLTSKYEWWDKVNSNPKRYSFLLWEWEKTKTPEKYLINKGIIKTFEELVTRFDVEVVRKEFFQLYMNLFLELYWEIQDNSTFHILIEQKKIEPVSFAKNLMGKMIFLYFIQKKWRLWVTDKNKTFGEGDRDFFKNNFEKLAHDANLFQKSMNFYNDFLEPLFYSGLNKKNTEDWHPKLNMKVPYLNGWLFQEEYDWENSIINLDNELFKNIIRSFDTYNFTIDEDDAHDREIAVDPEMLGKIFESMISVSKDNIEQIMEVYRDTKIKKKIIHPNPESILNIDIWKEINKKFWAFYTPREIVHYMTKESLVSYIVTKLSEVNPDQNALNNIVRKLFEYKDKHLTKQEIEEEKNDWYELLKKYVFDIQEGLKSLKILDPAVGSWAFPMWILQEILWLRRYLIDTFDLRVESDFEIKKQIVQNSIYGVDIDPGAIDIARLRFRLSLIVDAIEPMPLPNLDFKFICANSLIPLESGSLFTKQSVIDELARLRLEYFMCSDLIQKEILKKQFRWLQLELSWFWSKMKNEFKTTKEWKIYIEELVKQNTDLRNRQIMERDPFDVNTSNWWFDSQMMFGIEWFDIVIWNPPYVFSRWSDFSNEFKKTIAKSYSTWSWKINLFSLFIERWIKSLSISWIISYIIPNTLFRVTSYKPIRELIVKKTTFLSLVDLNETIFEWVTASTTVIVLKKLEILNENIKFISSFDDLKSWHITKNISQRKFINDEFVISIYDNDNDNDIFKKMKDNSVSLWEITKDIINWIVTPKWKNDFISDQKKGDNRLPFLEWKDIERYLIRNTNRYILYDRKLLHRARPQYVRDAKEKIIIRRIGWWKQTLFSTLDTSNYLTFASTNLILLKDNTYNYKYILWILNSKLINRFYVQNFTNWSNLTVNISKTYLEKIPIKYLSLIEQEPFIDLVNQILVKKKDNARVDTIDLEKRIDQMVYNLYGLTDEEIKVVEDSVK